MIESTIVENTAKAINELYDAEVKIQDIGLQKTRKEFNGDFTIVVFPFIRYSKKTPQKTAEEIGDFIVSHDEIVEKYNVIKGFLNLTLKDKFWKKFFLDNKNNSAFGFTKHFDGKPYVIEYSSPNTNKPLHLGHIRNNLLGFSLAQVLTANGKKVEKVNLLNDRGIHICKSMLAWEMWGNNETPDSTGIKGDHLIGKYYVMFEKRNNEVVNKLVQRGLAQEEAEKESPLLLEAQRLLKKWENKDAKIVSLWKKMNAWAYEGFSDTYDRLGVSFDKFYHESDTYLIGKKLVQEGLEQGILFEKEDGSIWADLSNEGLDEKLLLRADGTSVYITQDLGTAQLRHDEYDPEQLIYVVGNEQIYHFEVLKIILKKLGRTWAGNIYHLSYGMVDLPEGRMKSREGKVVDADDLMDEMYNTAMAMTMELGKIDGFSGQEAEKLYRIVGLGALKYFILKVDPQKNMLFNPEESIDFNGNTGPFIQYTYARIQSVLRKAVEEFSYNPAGLINIDFSFIQKERDILRIIYEYPAIVQQAGETLSPALVANYVYDLVKEYNQFYHDFSILREEDHNTSIFRIELSVFTGMVIKSAMGLLGIEMPERM
ncbi:MAG: arginine--tRNA ligase [Bacteroidales bacterium]|nr:arginine--tRNA ligase [Bacteroidales bacterium]